MEKIICQNMSYAPVLITTCNRYEHLKRCVESLSKCTLASETDLIISVDYPPSDKYVDGNELSPLFFGVSKRKLQNH